MSMTVVFKMPGVSQQQYDQVIKALEAKGAGKPDGRLYHIASAMKDGWMVIDIWESEGKLGQFAEVLMPTLQAAGITPPQPEVYPTYKVIPG